MSFSIGRGRYRTETYPKPSFPAGIAPDGGLGTSYVFRQGGTPAPGVFVTSAALAAAMLLVDPAAFKVVTVDTVDAPGGVAHIETGVTLPDNVLFKGGGSSALPTLTFDEGSHLAGNTYQALDIVLVNAATATPVWSPSASTGSVLNLTGSELTPAGAGAVFCDAVGPVSVTAVESSVGDATHALFAVESTGAVDWLGFDGSTIFPNTIKQGSAPGGVVNYVVDGASQRGTSVVQVPVPTVTVLDPLTTFVLQPGGTDGENVFTSFAALMAVANLCPGPKSLALDNRAGSCHMTAAATPWNLDGFTVYSLQPFGGTTRDFIIDEGATFTFQYLTTENVNLKSNATATTPMTITGGAQPKLRMFSGTMSVNIALGVPIFDVQNSAGSALVLEMWSTAALLTGNGPILKGDLPAANNYVMRLFDNSNLGASALTGAGNFAVNFSSGSVWSGTQAGVTGTVTFVAFNATNNVVGTNNTGTGGGTVTATSSTNLTRKKTGKVAVSGVASGTASGAGTMTATLQRDGVNIGTGVPFVTTATSLAFAIPVQFIDTLPDLAAHSYGIAVVASAGTITTAANGCQVQAIEQ